MMSMSVCLSVYLLAYLKNHLVSKFSVYVDCRRDWVLCWRGITLCTSDFVDGIMFSRNEPYDVLCIP